MTWTVDLEKREADVWEILSQGAAQLQMEITLTEYKLSVDQTSDFSRENGNLDFYIWVHILKY